MSIPFRKAFLWSGLCLSVLAFAGCETTGNDRTGVPPDVYTNSDEIRVGDMLTVTFRGGPSLNIMDHKERVSEEGFITLPQIGDVEAAGKSRVELQKEIQGRYVPDYYRNLTVTIAPDERFFYVYGEVNRPDRYLYTGELTVLGAISTAGDFTDFANPKKVQLLRTDGTSDIVNCRDALRSPSNNLEVLPGDTINVPRGIF